MPTNTRKKSIINAHTHVFTGNFVPPYLAKTIIPWPLYYLIHTGWMIRQFKRYYKLKYKNDFANAETEEERHKLWEAIYAGRRGERKRMNRRFFITSRWYLNIPYKLIGLWLSIVAGIYFIEFIAYLMEVNPETLKYVAQLKVYLSKCYLFYELPTIIKIAWVILVVWFVHWSRKLILFIVKNIFPIIKKVLNKKVLALLDRYYLLGRFSFYEKQHRVALRALHQLPPESSIVILPMDMEYMGAGKTKMTKEILRQKDDFIATKNWNETDFSEIYKYQMRELWDFVKKPDETGPKEAYFPFVFLDPRRIKEEGKAFFDYEVKQGKMVLKPCFIKTYMEDRSFSGFKIYPAIGYYPFDEHLLPIWRYASENNIPIMTHCVKGIIYYRGKKKKEWNFHPIFKQEYKRNVYEPMLLNYPKNVDFQINFTHPLNYLCLVEEKLLKMVLRTTDTDSEVRKLFGYSETEDTLECTLSNLKICLAHYGGEEEWIRYMEQDRRSSSQRLMRDPKEAIKFMENSNGEFSWYKLNDLWNKADWYSIICSLLIDYENIYADLSYIISKPSIYPLLKYTLEKDEDYATEHQAYMAEPIVNKKATHYTGKNKLRSRVLFGTDFYVVRNHKSDKDLFIETKTLLDEESFDLIARENTFNYLSRN